MVEGVYMRNWDTMDEKGECTSDRDWRDVQIVCDQLKIPCRQVIYNPLRNCIETYQKHNDDY